MTGILETLFIFSCCIVLVVSFHEQFRVPTSCSQNWESYVFGDKQYLVQNLPVNWENAKILCRGSHNGTLAILDTKEKAEFLAEALSESQLCGNPTVTRYNEYTARHVTPPVTLAILDAKEKAEFLAEALPESQLLIESLWVGARRQGADDAAGYRWSHGLELRRTAVDIVAEDEKEFDRHYPMWVNRTHIPVPEGGADCVALERVAHDKPVFLDLPCHLERPFACERDAQKEVKIVELKTVRCRAGLYRVYDGEITWHQAAAHCVLNKMALANIGTMRCLRKLGMVMLKARPSIENAWVGARGSLGKWWWIDTGADIFQASPYGDSAPGAWPPIRDRTSIKPDGCLQLDRHDTHPPVFMEARCDRKMQFICYQSAPSLLSPLRTTLPSDETYYYVLVHQHLNWQQAYDNCLKMNGTLAMVDTSDILIQLLLVMGETKDAPISHVWISGRLNSSHDVSTDTLSLNWYNPASKKKIPDSKTAVDMGVFIPPWLDEGFSMDSSCLNLDRQDHLNALVYGLPCDVPQPSICMIEKPSSLRSTAPTPVAIATENVTTGPIAIENGGVVETTDIHMKNKKRRRHINNNRTKYLTEASVKHFL